MCCFLCPWMGRGVFCKLCLSGFLFLTFAMMADEPLEGSREWAIKTVEPEGRRQLLSKFTFCSETQLLSCAILNSFPSSHKSKRIPQNSQFYSSGDNKSTFRYLFQKCWPSISCLFCRELNNFFFFRISNLMESVTQCCCKQSSSTFYRRLSNINKKLLLI